MKKIKAENTTFIYLFSTDRLSDAINAELNIDVKDIDTEITRKLARGIDTRVILVENIFKSRNYNVYYLYWDDETKLDLLDIKVANDSFTDRDFKYSVKTQYQKTNCFNCHLVWDTLIMPPGDPYLGSPGLMEKKVRDKKLLKCPNCKSSFRQLVVKILT